MSNPNSQWYPYHKVQEGFSDLSEMNIIPRKIIDYILDMPDGVYTPVDDNTRARVQLWKYLYYDGALPLNEPLPTPTQKKQVLFDPERPTQPPNPEKGYRIIPQIWIKQAQEEAQSRIYFHLGRAIAEDDFTVQQAVVFQILTHYTQETNTKISDAYSRSLTITQKLFEAFHGINMAGVGTFYFARSKHPDCGFTPITDKISNIGIELTLGLEVKSDTLNGNIENNETLMGIAPNGNKLYMG